MREVSKRIKELHSSDNLEIGYYYVGGQLKSAEGESNTSDDGFGLDDVKEYIKGFTQDHKWVVPGAIGGGGLGFLTGLGKTYGSPYGMAKSLLGRTLGGAGLGAGAGYITPIIADKLWSGGSPDEDEDDKLSTKDLEDEEGRVKQNTQESMEKVVKNSPGTLGVGATYDALGKPRGWSPEQFARYLIMKADLSPETQNKVFQWSRENASWYGGIEQLREDLPWTDLSQWISGDNPSNLYKGTKTMLARPIEGLDTFIKATSGSLGVRDWYKRRNEQAEKTREKTHDELDARAQRIGRKPLENVINPVTGAISALSGLESPPRGEFIGNSTNPADRSMAGEQFKIFNDVKNKK